MTEIIVETEEETLTFDVPDEALEIAAGTAPRFALSFSACDPIAEAQKGKGW